MPESEGQRPAPLNERSIALIEQKLKHNISIDPSLKSQYEEQLKSMDGPVIEVTRGEPVKTKPISPEDLADAEKILREGRGMVLPEVEKEPEPITIPDGPVVNNENTRPEKTEDLIKENHLEISDLLIAKDFDEDEFDNKYALIYRLIKSSKYDWAKKIVERLDGNNYEEKEVYETARVIYLVSVMGEKVYRDIREKSNSLKDIEKETGIVNMLGRERQKAYLITKANTVASSDLGDVWEANDPRLNNLKKYLERTFNKTEIVEDKSDYGVVARILKEPYLGTDNIGLNLNFKIDKEPKADLIRQMVKVHDITVMLDNPTYKPENVRPELLQSVDEALVAMLSLKKGTMLIVPKVIETYDAVMREMYITIGREIDIDNGDIHDEVFRRVRRGFGSDEEANLFIKMGRDVCRITGVDAQYGYPARVESGVSSGLALTVKGSFLRGLLNYNKALIGYGTDARLTGGINLGIVPFWNKLRRIDGVESAPITEEIVGNLIRDKMIGSENYLGWFGALKGYAEAKKVEGEFIAMPTLDNFVTKLIPAYWGYMQYTPIEAKKYFWRRLDSVVPFFISKGEGRDRLKASIANLFLKDGVFDGKGVFDNAQELKHYFTRTYGIYVDIDAVNLKTRREAAMDAGRRGSIVDTIKSIFK